MNTPITDWREKRVWIVGASSGIGRATASALHAAGARVIVSARQAESLDEFVATHPGAVARAVDACDKDAVAAVSRELQVAAPLDVVMYCAGHYRPQRATAFDLNEMLRHQQVNYVGALHVLDAVLPSMLARRAGLLSLVSSVAGYRGLPQGLAYGPTKAALINLAETLSLDLRGSGVDVSLINPGFVSTPLTATNRFHMPGLVTADQAAREILRGWGRGRFETHFPRRFTWWMKLLRLLPYRPYFAVVHRVTGL